MNLGLYISELLHDHEMVIVPGFGAFTTEYKPAEFDEEENKMLPPSKNVAFSDKIKNNDGLLVGFLAEKESISHFDALHVIENSREDILYRLDKGEKVEIEKVGFLFHRDDGSIGFEPTGGENFLPDAFGLGALSLNEPGNLETEDAEPAGILPEETDVAGDQEAELSNEEDIGEEEPDFEPVEKLESYNASGVHEQEEQEFEPVENLAGGAGTFEGDQKYDPKNRPDTYVQQVRHNKNRNLLLLVLILIPLLSAGIYLFLRQDKDTSEGNEPPVENVAPVQEETEPIPAATDTLPGDSASVASSVEETVEESALPAMDGEQYYLVGGSFKEEENVEEYMAQLREKGYEPFRMGKRGNFYMIGIGRYATIREAAVAQQEFLDQNPGSGAWILKEGEQDTIN